MLEVRDVHKSFGDLEILRGVSLKVEKGDIDVVIGASGSGKTTLLRCIDLLEMPDSGQIIIGDLQADYKTITKQQTIDIRRHMGFVFQNYSLFRNKTALENVMLGLTVVRKMPKAEALERAREAIDKVGLLDRADHYPAQLSGGQQQRIGIARAFVSNPDIILLDEPTSSLDPGLVNEVLDTISQLAEEGTTMLIVTHELGFARDVATNMLFLHEGAVLESAPTAEFFASPTHEETRDFLRRSRAL